MKPIEGGLPRIALLISDATILQETEEILRGYYSSLLIITEKEKLKEFSVPLIVVVDRVKDVFDIRKLHPVEGTRVLVILKDCDSETMGAAFDVGADDFLTHPFSKDAFIEKTEKYLEAFRPAA